MKNLTFLILTFLFLLSAHSISAQDNGNAESVNFKKAELTNSGAYQSAEIASLDIDTLRNAMSKQTNSRGVIFIFCGKVCKYREVEAHLLGLNISLRGKGWKKEEYIALNGGFREELTIEYWLLPENAGLPIPNSTVEIKDVKFRGTFKGKFVPYDCCEY